MTWTLNRDEWRQRQGYNREEELVDAIDRKPGRVLEGWKAIQEFFKGLSGIERSDDTLKRYARRKHDPLPVFKSPGGRIVVAKDCDLEAWWKRHSFTY